MAQKAKGLLSNLAKPSLIPGAHAKGWMLQHASVIPALLRGGRRWKENQPEALGSAVLKLTRPCLNEVEGKNQA